VRLTSGTGACEGTVEVYSEGRWGTVCSNMWDIPDAKVVCKELGCGSAVSAPHSITQVGAFLLNNVRCHGNESHLWQCESDRWDREDCKSESDALIVCSDAMKLRLGEAITPCAGVVDVYYRGTWGTVCSQLWDLKDAAVVCKQLGCGEPEAAPSKSRYGRAGGSIWLDRVQCTGNESFLWECQAETLGHHECNHWMAAAVVCKDSIKLTLLNGSSPCAGRLEEKTGIIQGTISHTALDMHGAEVICQQLHCGSVASIKRKKYFGKGAGLVWNNKFSCSGSEDFLWQCNYTVRDAFRLDHSSDVGFFCSKHRAPRLVGGADSCSGRVEIQYGETWGAVCDRNWDIHDADVVCRQLKCGFALPTPGGASFGEGAGPIWGDRVDCQGNESILWECPFTPQGPQNCTHKNTAAVICSGHCGPRLVDGESKCSGRVEILYGNTWGSVCDQYLDLEDANVICEHLSCGVAVSVLRGAHFGTGDGPMWRDSFHCRGSESRLWECPTTWDQQSCRNNNTAGVICSGENWQLRLLNGGSRCDGRLEVFYNGIWGRVLDDSWDLNDANVVCRQLDCGSALQAYNSSQYGHGAGPVWLNGVECLGNESALHHCKRLPTGQSDARDGWDVGILCSEHLKLRLVGRGGHCSGRVEVYYNGSWGTVCDDQWDLSDAEVVCKQLGCGHAITATTLAVFGEGTGPVWLDDMQCRGNESLLWECPLVEWGQHNCKHREDAGVVCSEFKELKLVSDQHDCAGRVEVFYNGTWGSVCSNNVKEGTIRVICQQMGCGHTGTLDKQFGEEGSGPIWLDGLNCLGYESVLWQCPSLPWGQSKCTQGEVAQLACQEHLEVRLAGGDSECSGRVEVRYNGSWGTVCDESWDLNAASVVCRQLDCGSAVAVVSDAGFGDGSGPVWLDEVHCRGSESLLIHCDLFGGVRDCGHKEDAGVVC
uniref:SRCR domain-containing protein n=1 Tax=Latimeria chalumnae TaxID=7897 RepID=H3A1V7_LATCH